MYNDLYILCSGVTSLFNLGGVMKFDSNDYPAIKQACMEKRNIEFEVEKSATLFSGSDAPNEWAEYPPSQLTNSDLAKVMAYLTLDPSPQAALHRLEQIVYLEGASVYYKKVDEDIVAVRVEW